MTLRARLALTSVALVAIGLLVAGFATYRFLSDFLLDRVDTQLLATQGFAEGALLETAGEGPGDPDRPGPGVSTLPYGTYAAAVEESGEVIVAVTVPQQATISPPRFDDHIPAGDGPVLFTTTSDDGSVRYRVLTVPFHGQPATLVVAIPLTDVTATLRQLVVVEFLVGMAVLVAVGALAFWVVRVGLRPLEGIGETAGAIAAGDLTRRVAPADDRTEVGRLGLSLNAMLAQIEAAFEERRASEARLRRFVADASHELRTPLTSIRGYAELFRRGADSRPEDLEKSMARIEAEAARMGILVDDLLLLARLDQGRPLERDDVPLDVVVTEGVEAARTVDPGRPIDLTIDGDVRVIGDRDRLRQVVDNLLDNTRVHTPAGTPVQVTLARTGDDVTVTVRDEGPGLDPGAGERVFERFYRGDPARSRETGGAGLGLSIVAAIVEAHGGSVSASTPTGGGASFQVRLPARKTSPTPDPSHPA